MASMPFVAYGILNYLRLASTQNLRRLAGGGGLFARVSTQLCALGWIASVLWSLKASSLVKIVLNTS